MMRIAVFHRVKSSVTRPASRVRYYSSRLMTVTVSWAVFMAFAATSPAHAENVAAAKQRQRRAAARIAANRAYVKKTGDRRSRAGELTQTQRDLEQSFATFKSAGDLRAAAACGVQLADVIRHQHKFKAAITIYVESEKLARRANDTTSEARCLVGQTIVRLMTKDYEAATVSANTAIRIATPLKEKRALFEAQSLKCEIELAQNKLAAAEYWINEAFKNNSVKDRALLFYAYLDRSSVYFEFAKLGDFQATYHFSAQMADKAALDAKSAVALGKALGWDFMARHAAKMMQAAQLRRQLIEQNNSYDRMVRQFRIKSFDPQTAADVHVSQQFTFEDAAELPQNLIALAKQWEAAATGEAVRAFVRARIDHVTGNADAALAGSLRAIGLLERDYRELADVEARGTLIGPKVDYYYWPMLQLLQRKRNAEAFRLMESSRSRMLNDLITTKATIALADAGQRRLYSRLKNLRAKISGQFTRYERLFRADPDAPQSKEMADQLAELEAHRKQLLNEIRAKAPQLLQLIAADTVPLKDVQTAASRHGYDVLEYMVMPSSIVAWHIGENGVHVRSIFMPKVRLDQKIAALRKSLASPASAFDTATSRQLFLFLVQPLLKFITTDHLVVIPHESLYDVPFQVFQNPSDGRFVGERFRVSYAPNAAVLARLQSGVQLKGSTVLAVAGPKLNEAQAEVDAIVRGFPGSKAVEVKLATETYVKRISAGYDVLHVACHGQFIAPDPMLSFVSLKATKSDDGRLTAAEMFAMPLRNVRLVTLSACETGRVSGTHAGEILGIPRALIYAGAQSVLLSQWRVDSKATLEWMRHFYREASRANVAEASRRAIVALKSQPRYAHPFYWGAFYLMGR